jgi:hypothetical protein
MRLGVALMGCVALGVAMTAMAGEERFRESHYPSLFYTLRAVESKEPGIYRMRLDNRTLELTLSDPTPDAFFMPEAVVSKGDEAFQKRLQQKRGTLTGFTADWRYGLLRGIFTPFFDDSNGGGIGATVEVVPDPYAVITDPSYSVPIGTIGNVVSHHRIIKLDYFKLDDFIRAVCGERSNNTCWEEVINGRRWVREIILPQPAVNLASYSERLHTPLDRRRILTIGIGLGDDIRRYATPEDMPRWMQQVNKNIEALLRSVKISPPDDGSPDPFLIDPEQKAEANPVVFPARRPHPASGPSPR